VASDFENSSFIHVHTTDEEPHLIMLEEASVGYEDLVPCLQKHLTPPHISVVRSRQAVVGIPRLPILRSLFPLREA
jgi:hypothetical protein